MSNLEELESKWGDIGEGTDGIAGEGSNSSQLIPEAALATSDPVHLQIFYDDDAHGSAPAIRDDDEEEA
jgi:hypothetical protein